MSFITHKQRGTQKWLAVILAVLLFTPRGASLASLGDIIGNHPRNGGSGSSGSNSDLIGLDKAANVGLDSLSPVDIIQNAVQYIASLAAIITLGVFIYGAVMFILSAGDESRAAKAKKIMLFAIVGLLLVGGAYAVIAIVQAVLGVKAS